MTRTEIEAIIAQKLAEIRDVVRQYNPDNDYLSMCIRGETVTANNTYWEKGNTESEFPIHFFKGDGMEIESLPCRIEEAVDE